MLINLNIGGVFMKCNCGSENIGMINFGNVEVSKITSYVSDAKEECIVGLPDEVKSIRTSAIGYICLGCLTILDLKGNLTKQQLKHLN